MKLLLDTHIWVSMLLEPKRVSRKVQAHLDRSTNELWLSPLSSLEVLNLCAKGRLRLRPSPERWIEDAWKDRPFREAPLSQYVVMCTPDVVLPHRDPVDNLLAATARAYGLTLVTADAAMLAGKGFNVLANR
jgi:PIN domain nuclease of toxin-antitoxin system